MYARAMQVALHEGYRECMWFPEALTILVARPRGRMGCTLTRQCCKVQRRTLRHFERRCLC
ncbi:hypothetical protein CBM2586_A10280 [Cupriavidus phytorum]|uniref:Uncharacterized protein n=1 Tax=Cupriavidus taiwanensis TaxID=164546 RepID=A0A975WPG3_9BURK|nr:hypothetical protein CBM2586_A10280 [Cupriavidus taiwanensis]